MPWTREENFFPHYLFGDKIIPNFLKIDTLHEHDNDLLLRQENQKNIAYPESWRLKQIVE